MIQYIKQLREAYRELRKEPRDTFSKDGLRHKWLYLFDKTYRTNVKYARAFAKDYTEHYGRSYYCGD